jgi:tetratricopeptide (TPR) repeat protein/tRNA A-37 threonylcarbamoyl transferase component Bud32
MPVTMPGPGDVLGHFRLIEQIGAGGMGIVYRARDQRLDRDVAVKVLNEKTLAEKSSRQRFRHEALVLGRLSHPNVEIVYDFHTENGLDYLVLEFVAGQSLDERLKGRPLADAEVTRLGLQMAQGLAAAHAQGVIHGDLKPSNLRVTPENVLKILDFGLAQILASPDAKTLTDDDSSGAMAYGGTPPYMSPEQIEGQTPDKLSDIYSAGVVLYEMASGSRPFPQRGSLLREAILYFPVPSIREKNPEISTRLESVILRCLEKSPRKRCQSAQELAIELEQVVTGSTWSAVFWRAMFAARRHRWWSAAVLSVLVLATVFGVRHWMANRTPPPKMSVVVAEFANRTGEQMFDQTPRELIAIALAQSPQVSVLPSSRLPDVLKRMKIPATSPVDERIAEEICTREGLQSVVGGSMSKLGSRYMVVARVLNCNGDLILSVDKQFGGPEQLPPVIDEIAASIRRGWGESETAIQQASQPLATVTSSSLEAIRLYSSGRQELYRGNFADAITLFKKAVELDSEFAMAHEYLATAYVHQANSERANEEYAKAAQLSNRVTEKEREKILGDYALFRSDNDAAISHYQILAVLSPEDPAAHINLAESYRNEFRQDQAIAEVKKALELAESPSVRNNLATYYYMAGKPEDAWREVQQVLKESPDNVKGLYLLSSYYLGLGQEHQARAVLERMLSLGGSAASLARADLADAAWTRDELSEAASQLESGIITDGQVNNIYEMTRKQILLAELYLAMGKQKAMSDLLGKIRQASDPQLVFLLGRIHTRAGHVSAAQQQLRDLENLPHQTPMAQSLQNILQAEIAMTQKQRSEAVRFAALAVEHLTSPMALEVSARANELSGNAKEAARQYELLLARSNEMQYDNVDWPALHNVAAARYRLGVLYQSMGQGNLAATQFNALMKYAVQGQPTGPIYQDARNRLAQVSSKPGGPVDQPPPRREPTR